jgi:hypothetical protein
VVVPLSFTVFTKPAIRAAMNRAHTLKARFLGIKTEEGVYQQGTMKRMMLTYINLYYLYFTFKKTPEPKGN